MAIQRTTVHPVVGKVEWETDKLESGHPIKLLNNFEKNIGLVLVPQLVNINDVRTDALQKAGAKFNGKLKFFKGAHAQLLAAFAEIEKAGLKKRLVSIAGSFNPRLQKRRMAGLSKLLPIIPSARRSTSTRISTRRGRSRLPSVNRVPFANWFRSLKSMGSGGEVHFRHPTECISK